MPPRIETLDKVPENKLQEIIKSFSEDDASIVTAINDGKGTFTVEATFLGGGGGSHASVIKTGKMSTFGGPQDTGVSPSEGLALFDASDIAPNPQLFLAAQPAGTTGLARRLDPDAKYLACRWDYSVTPRNFLKQNTVTVSA